MAGDYWDPREGSRQPVRYRRMGNGARSRYVPVIDSQQGELTFDPSEDYLRGDKSARAQILSSFDALRRLALEPSAHWKSKDTRVAGGILVHSTRLIVDAQMVFESVVLATGPHEELLESARQARMLTVRLLHDVDTLQKRTPNSAEARNALEYIREALNRHAGSLNRPVFSRSR